MVTIRYVDEKEGRALNLQFRGKDYATNVLTFVHEVAPSPLAGEGWGGVRVSQLQRSTPSQPPPARGGGAEIRSNAYSADIVICAPVIAREAREQKKPVASHHGHMVLHGMLHAQGFDHEDSVEAEAMEALEIALLRRFRIDNPYETA